MQTTPETITVGQIRALSQEASEAGDTEQRAICDYALQLLRDRARGIIEWPASLPPRELSACVEAINAAGAVGHSGLLPKETTC